MNQVNPPRPQGQADRSDIMLYGIGKMTQWICLRILQHISWLSVNTMNTERKFGENLRKSLVLLIYKIVELKIGLVGKLNGSHFNIEIILLLKLTVAENLFLIANANIERLIRLSRIETGLNSFSRLYPSMIFIVFTSLQFSCTIEDGFRSPSGLSGYYFQRLMHAVTIQILLTNL